MATSVVLSVSYSLVGFVAPQVRAVLRRFLKTVRVLWISNKTHKNDNWVFLCHGAGCLGPLTSSQLHFLHPSPSNPSPCIFPLCILITLIPATPAHLYPFIPSLSQPSPSIFFLHFRINIIWKPGKSWAMFWRGNQDAVEAKPVKRRVLQKDG